MKADALIAKVPDLPVPSLSVTRLIGLLQQPDTDNEDVIRIVRQVAVLSAKLLALCNTAAFGFSGPVASIQQAVLHLGQREIHRLVMAISFGGALGAPLPGYAIEESALWRHSLLTAQVTGFVIAAAPRIHADVSVAYTAGLLHDLGKLVLSHALDLTAQIAVRALVDGGGHSLVEAEREVIGADHAEVGAALLQNWKLPEIIVEAVARHHQPPPGPPPLSAVVHVADVIAHVAGSAPGQGGYAVRVGQGVAEALGLGPIEIQNLILAAVEAAGEIETTLAVA